LCGTRAAVCALISGKPFVVQFGSIGFIEIILEVTVTEEWIPFIGRFGAVADRSGEPIVEHHVELSTDVQCLQMEDKRDSTAVGLTKEESAAGLGFPARNLLAMLEAGLKYIGGAPPHV
jgi:hypothetical protein